MHYMQLEEKLTTIVASTGTSTGVQVPVPMSSTKIARLRIPVVFCPQMVHKYDIFMGLNYLSVTFSAFCGVCSQG